MKTRSYSLTYCAGTLFALLAFATPALHAQTQVIYDETFTNAQTTDDSFTDVGWTLLSGATATDNSTTLNLATSTDAGPLNGVNNAQSGTVGHGVYGFRLGGTNATGQFLTYTSEFLSTVPGASSGLTLDLSSSSPDTISWSQYSRNSAAVGVNLALLTSSGWYVSNTLFDPAAQGTTTTFNLETDSLKSELWAPLSVAAGTSLAGSTPTSGYGALPSDVILGAGWYGASGQTNTDLRLDNFTITIAATQTVAVPEPSTVALMLGGASLLLVFLRRRRIS